MIILSLKLKNPFKEQQLVNFVGLKADGTILDEKLLLTSINMCIRGVNALCKVIHVYVAYVIAAPLSKIKHIEFRCNHLMWTFGNAVVLVLYDT